MYQYYHNEWCTRVNRQSHYTTLHGGCEACLCITVLPSIYFIHSQYQRYHSLSISIGGGTIYLTVYLASILIHNDWCNLLHLQVVLQPTNIVRWTLGVRIFSFTSFNSSIMRNITIKLYGSSIV